VIVSSPSVPHPAQVRYAWQSNPEATLFNGAGLPAEPFRTDDWPGKTKDARPYWCSAALPAIADSVCLSFTMRPLLAKTLSHREGVWPVTNPLEDA
jgi:hypothetical protein